MKLLNKIFKRKPPSEFWMMFTRAVHQRGVVAYVDVAPGQRIINGAGLNETISTEGTRVRLILLPGDDHSQVNENNLVAFEPLNRRVRKAMLEERNKLI